MMGMNPMAMRMGMMPGGPMAMGMGMGGMPFNPAMGMMGPRGMQMGMGAQRPAAGGAAKRPRDEPKVQDGW